MKIVLINASARKNGATARILDAFAENLSAKGNVEIVKVSLTEIKLDFCSGCCLCYKNGVCHIDDDADALSEQISASTGISWRRLSLTSRR